MGRTDESVNLTNMGINGCTYTRQLPSDSHAAVQHERTGYEKETKGWEYQASVRDGGGKGFFQIASSRRDSRRGNSYADEVGALPDLLVARRDRWKLRHGTGGGNDGTLVNASFQECLNHSLHKSANRQTGLYSGLELMCVSPCLPLPSAWRYAGLQ